MNEEVASKTADQKLSELLEQDLPVSNIPASEFKIIGTNTDVVINNVKPKEE